MREMLVLLGLHISVATAGSDSHSLLHKCQTHLKYFLLVMTLYTCSYRHVDLLEAGQVTFAFGRCAPPISSFQQGQKCSEVRFLLCDLQLCSRNCGVLQTCWLMGNVLNRSSIQWQRRVWRSRSGRLHHLNERVVITGGKEGPIKP